MCPPSFFIYCSYSLGHQLGVLLLDVPAEDGLLVKGGTTELTAKGLLAGMDEHVSLEAIRVSEKLTAH